MHLDIFNQSRYPVLVTKRAKLFLNGGSQAVRLPKEFRFDGDEVAIRRDGKRVILEPIDEWSQDFLDILGSVEGPIPRPDQEPPKDPFR